MMHIHDAHYLLGNLRESPFKIELWIIEIYNILKHVKLLKNVCFEMIDKKDILWDY